jgi:putative spermidine/putrescine transport system substrate-binding protein
MKAKYLKVGVAVAAAISLSVTGCGDDSGSGGGSGDDLSGELVFAGWGGNLGNAEQKAYIDGFTELHPNVSILYDEGVDFAKLKAMVETGGTPSWDIFAASVPDPDHGKYLEKLDCSIIPCDELMEDTQNDDFQKVYYTYSTAMTYAKDEHQADHPTTWQEFFDFQKFPGKRAIPNAPGSEQLPLLIGLLADGVPADQLYPIDIDRALSKYDEVRDNIVFYSNSPECTQLLQDGEVEYGACLTGDVYSSNDGGDDLAIEFNQNIASTGAMGIVKGSANAKVAEAFMAYVLGRDTNAKITDYFGYGPANTQATNINPAVEPYLPSSDPDAKTIPYDTNNEMAQLDEMSERWQQWLQQ